MLCSNTTGDRSYQARKVGMTKKILYLRTDLVDGQLVAGGSVSHTLGVIKGFIHHGHQVVCAASTMIELLSTLPLQKLIVLQNPSWLQFLRWKLNSFVSTLFFAIQASSLIKQHSIDMIYQRYSILNATGVLLSRWYNKPFILEYNGSEVWVNRNWTPQTRFKLNWLINWIELVNLRYAHSIVVVSDALKDELQQRGIAPSKIIVNPNGVDATFFDSHNAKTDAKQPYTFGFVGTFSAWHGIPTLCSMIPEVIRIKHNVHFLLIGDGPLKNEAEKVLQHYVDTGYVTFTGIQSAAKTRDLLALCDAFLCPTQPNLDGSRFFGSPTKLFEYMSMAKPIIASDLEQLAQIISPALRLHDIHEIHDEVGILVQPTDVAGFIKAACCVIDMQQNNALQLKRMGINAREKVLKEYTWNQHVHRILHHIEESRLG